MSNILVVFVAVTLIGMAGITLINVFVFPRLSRKYPASNFTPLVSILIPARNEAAVIQTTLEKLLAQAYPNYEVLLLDDNSTDETGKIARSLNDPRLTVLSGAPLPNGWLGKNWACHQLAQMAQGEILIFTDADVRWEAGSLDAVIAEMQRTNADLLTIWPTQITVTWAERLVVSLMALAIVGYLPVIGTHYTPIAAFAAACGQGMVWKRSAYQAVGGHAAVRDNVLEDVTLARILKRKRLRLRMEDGAGLIACRMYTDWQTVRDGYAKNILAGYGNNIPALLLGVIFHWIVFVLPWFWLLAGAFGLGSSGWPEWPLVLITLGVGVRMLTAAFTRQRVMDGLLMPISVGLMTLIAFRSIYWKLRYGGPNWKGRAIKQQAHA